MSRMTKAPLILVTPSTQTSGAEFYDYSISLSDAYPRAVLAGGGLPWVPPCIPEPQLVAEYVRRSDGVLLSGGDDIQPELYDPEVSAELKETCGEHDKVRDLFEMLVLKEVFAQRKPLLAICRGYQLLNISLGGTLLVDIPSQRPGAIKHNRMDIKDNAVHDILIEPDSLMAGILGVNRVGVNSSHHQAIDKLAAPLKVTARAEDGMVEAIEFVKQNVELLPYMIGVQYHPERLLQSLPVHRELFRSFATAAALSRGASRP